MTTATKSIKGLYGEDIEEGDRVVVSWNSKGRGYSPRLARGVITYFNTGGFGIKFDQPITRYSNTYGCKDIRDHYICMHNHGGSKANRYDLDGYPCRDGEEYVASEELYDANQGGS